MKSWFKMKPKSIGGMIIVIVVLLNLLLFFLNYSVFTGKNLGSSYKVIEGESCIQCHLNTKGYSSYHNPENIGCASCHLGNTESLRKKKAHEGMVLIPGNLSDAKLTCGKCHPDELHKIENSLMTSNSGIIAVDKFIFGESENIDSQFHIQDLQFSAADKHLRDLCANCHLGAQKVEFGPITQSSRGGGCNACHLNYSDEAKDDLGQYLDSNKKILPQTHPSTDIFVNDNHCFGCHSRSGRISTNYMGLQETLLKENEITNNESFVSLEDGRVYKIQTEDVHHASGLLCVDCHSSHEVMGDGNVYSHKEEAVSIHCADCHFKDRPNTIPYDSLDTESQLVFLHRDYKHKDKEILVTEKKPHPLVNTFVDSDGNAFLIGKGDGVLHPLLPQAQVCSGDNAHKNISCSSCHSAWVPRCIGCHNEFDKDEKQGFDLLDKKFVKGQWKEYVAEFSASKPGLGVRDHEKEKMIEPATPGMIMTIDKGSYEGNIGSDISFHRLYAPTSPHTTLKEVRDCKSCHSNPAALGYGNGTLTYNTDDGIGNWEFTSEYAKNPNDKLPEDAWIPFLKDLDDQINYSTRSDFRPFSLTEQKNILMVGACLQCHDDNSNVMKETLIKGLTPVLNERSKACILPEQ